MITRPQKSLYSCGFPPVYRLFLCLKSSKNQQKINRALKINTKHTSLTASPGQNVRLILSGCLFSPMIKYRCVLSTIYSTNSTTAHFERDTERYSTIQNNRTQLKRYTDNVPACTIGTILVPCFVLVR